MQVHQPNTSVMSTIVPVSHVSTQTVSLEGTLKMLHRCLHFYRVYMDIKKILQLVQKVNEIIKKDYEKDDDHARSKLEDDVKLMQRLDRAIGRFV